MIVGDIEGKNILSDISVNQPAQKKIIYILDKQGDKLWDTESCWTIEF